MASASVRAADTPPDPFTATRYHSLAVVARSVPEVLLAANESLVAYRRHHRSDVELPLVNELLLSPMGRRDWPLRFYSAERLFSVEARRKFVPPDIAALP